MTAKAAIAALARLVATPARADEVSRWRAYVEEASARFGVPIEWIDRVMRAESGGWTVIGGRPTTSQAGAMGLMQIMPGTWADMRARLGLGTDPHDPRDNILAGALYLRLMYDRFGYPGLFAAYNAGPGRYAAHLASGRPLPGETRAYLATVGGASSVPVNRAEARPTNAIFFALSTTRPVAATADAASPRGMFIAINGGENDR